MFMFNSSNHGHNPISFPDHSNFHFPSPFDDTPGLILQQEDIFLHHPSNFTNVSTDHVMSNMAEQQQSQRKRASSKRDRHSKINTLRGPRDRRMRLSLPVARQFFGLQDMLGVDKASKTVEWLLFQSRHAIKKLSRDNSPSSVSDGEVVSGIDETAAVVVVDDNNKKEGRKAMAKEKRGRAARKTALFHPRARECREKARARARARTREKQLQIREKLLSEGNPIEEIEGRKQDVSKISSSGSEESAGTHQQIDNQQLRRRDEGIIIDDDPDHDCLMMMGRPWSPSSNSIIYNSLHNNNGSPQEVSSNNSSSILM